MHDIESFLHKFRFNLSLEKELNSSDIVNAFKIELIDTINYLDTLLNDNIYKKISNSLICELNNKGVKMSDSFWDNENTKILFSIISVYIFKKISGDKNFNEEYKNNILSLLFSDDFIKAIHEEILNLNKGLKNKYIVSICLN